VRTTSSRRARGPESSRWLFVRGRGDRPLPAAVRAEQLQTHHSTRRPTVAKGDLAICYASVWQAIFAVVEVVSDAEHDPAKERWSWRFGIRPLAYIADLHRAPAVEEAGVFPQSLWRHSYIRLTAEQFATARTLVEARQ
jgi:EVE domain